MLPHDDGTMAWHLTGTDYFSTIDHEEFNQTSAFWQRDTIAENDHVYRAEYLAWLIFTEHERSGRMDELRKSVTVPEETQSLTRAAAEANLDHQYQRGLHDYDAARILTSLVELADSAGLLRFPATARCLALEWWQNLLTTDQRLASRLQRRCRSLARLEQTFSSAAGSAMLAELEQSLRIYAREDQQKLIPTTSAYAFQELCLHDDVQWLLAGAASDLQLQCQKDLNQRGLA